MTKRTGVKLKKPAKAKKVKAAALFLSRDKQGSDCDLWFGGPPEMDELGKWDFGDDTKRIVLTLPYVEMKQLLPDIQHLPRGSYVGLNSLISTNGAHPIVKGVVPKKENVVRTQPFNAKPIRDDDDEEYRDDLDD